MHELKNGRSGHLPFFLSCKMNYRMEEQNIKKITV
jgi:hypothetical protein